MADLHGWLGRLALVLAALDAAWLLVLAVTRRIPGRPTVLLIGTTVAVIGVVALIGLFTAVLSAPPHDLLHWLYAGLALVSLPVAVFVGVSRPARQQAVVLFLGAIALVVFVVRLIQTGG
jgi:hypothetical protein